MNIAVDIQPLATESARRGMGVYTRNLLEEMFRQDTENTYFLFNPYGDSCIDDAQLPGNVRYEKFYPGADSYLLDYVLEPHTGEVGMKYEGLVEGLFQTFIHRNNIDLFLVTSPFDVHMVYKPAWFAGVRTACIFYDLVPWLFPRQYMAGSQVRSRYNRVMEFVKGADVLLAISQSAKDDVVRHMGVDAERVQVIHAGVSSGFAIAEFTGEQQAEAYAKYGIDSEFLLFPSGDDFRKNALNTVRAYAALPAETQTACQLVVTGKSPAAEMEQIGALCAQEGIEGRVLFTGHIPYEDLLLLYNNARLVLFASLYEGFGLPVIEAFKCGKNVVTSDNSSLGEVARGAAVLVDPHSPDDIARGVCEALQMEDFSAFDKVKAQRIAFYTWENSARLALQALHRLEPLRAAQPQRRKIALFSPLPPMQAEAAVLGEALLADLETYCDVDVYVEGGYRTGRYLRVLHHGLFPAHKDTYDAVLYHVTDDTISLYMLPYLMQYGGVALMRDAGIHGALLQACREGVLDWKLYRKFLTEEVEDARLFAHEVRENPGFAAAAQQAVDVNRTFLDRADKIVVWEEKLRERLLEKNVGYCVHVAEEAEDLLQFVFGWRKRFFDDADLAYICGYELPHRGLEDADAELSKVLDTLYYVMRGDSL